MKQKNFFMIFIMSIFMLLTLSFTGCQWSNGFNEALIIDTSAEYRFFYNNDEDADFICEYYLIGSSIIFSDMPMKKMDGYKIGYHVSAYNFLRDAYNLNTDLPSNIELNEAGNVYSIDVNARPYDFYAIWSPNDDTKYRVRHFKQTLDLQNYEEDISLSQVLTGTTDTLTNASPLELDGFTAQEITQVNIEPDGSAVVDVYYDRNYVTLTIDYNNGSTPFTRSGYYGHEVEDLSIPDRTANGLSFRAWSFHYADDTFDTTNAETFTYPAQDAEVYILWEEILYSISWVLKSSSSMAITPSWISGYEPASCFTCNTGCTLPTQDKIVYSGYDFDGWYEDASFTIPATSWIYGEVGDKVLYAKWNPISYSITYETNGGSLSGSETTSFNLESNVILPTSSEISRSGYTFAGWYTDSNFSGSSLLGWAAGEKTENVTLYAKWVTSSSVKPSYPSSSEPSFEITTANYTAGTGLSYAVNYSGTGVTYRWFLDGELITGASTNSGRYTISLSPGFYSLVVVVTDGSNQYSKERVFQVTN